MASFRGNPLRASSVLSAADTSRVGGYRVTQRELFRLARRRQRQVRRFLTWAAQMEEGRDSLRWNARHDIEDAREAGAMFGEPWWGVVVFSSFGLFAVRRQLPETSTGRFRLTRHSGS